MIHALGRHRFFISWTKHVTSRLSQALMAPRETRRQSLELDGGCIGMARWIKRIDWMARWTKWKFKLDIDFFSKSFTKHDCWSPSPRKLHSGRPTLLHWQSVQICQCFPTYHPCNEIIKQDSSTWLHKAPFRNPFLACKRHAKILAEGRLCERVGSFFYGAWLSGSTMYGMNSHELHFKKP